MRALAAQSLGPVSGLNIIDLPTPEAGPGQVRVKVAATSINPADFKTLTGQMSMLHSTGFPMVTGWDFSGTVDALGMGVEGLALGQSVFGFHRYSRSTKQGALAEYTVAGAQTLALKPDSVGHDRAAAAATTGVTALQALRGARTGPGCRVLITGASGGVGSIAIGVARRLGADVDALSSHAFIRPVADLGAEKVWDRGTRDWMSAQGLYDVILDAAAAYSYSSLRGLLKSGGRYITTLPKLSVLTDFFHSRLLGQSSRIVMVSPNRADLVQVAQWLENGLAVPIAEHYPLERGAQAVARSAQSDYFGKLVVTVG